MGDLQNGASSASGQLQKSSSLNEDFGSDFLTSWKSANLPKDEMDFDMIDVPNKGKNPFNFEKMDDFELGGNFDKISSFKVDMSDLDFSSPVKKADKPKEKSGKETGNKEAKQQKFSFAFDFNDLDRFSLDSDLLKGKKMSKGNDFPDHSSKHSGDQDTRCNSIKSTDTYVVTSRPRDLSPPSTDNGSHLSTSNQAQTDAPPDVRSLAQKKIVSSTEEMKIDTDTLGCPREPSDGACSKELSAKLATHESSLMFSSNNSLRDAHPRLSSGDAPKSQPSKEQEDSIRSVGSSQSRNSSPVNSCNSKWGTPENKRELPKHKSCEDGDESTRGSRTIIESAIHQNVVGKISDANTPRNRAYGSNNVGEKKDQSLMVLSSVSQRHLISSKQLGLKEKSVGVLQSKFLEKPADDASQSVAFFNQKQHHTIPHEKADNMHVFPFSEKCEPNRKGLSENEKGDTSKLLDTSITKNKLNSLGKEKSRALDASCSQLQLSSSLRQPTANSNAKSSTRDIVSSIFPKKSSSIISLEKFNMSLVHDKRSEASNLTLSRLTKLNISTPKTKMQKETSSEKPSKGNTVLLQSTLTKVTNHANKEDQPLRSPLLKRKKLEEPKEDSVTLYPSKRVTNTSNERKSLEASPEINIDLRPSPRSCHIGTIADHTTPHGDLGVRSMRSFDVPVLVENDGNFEKAEACSRELDDICNMLKKRHEEAKELLVRVMVNNNTLLMLNHPMLDEKINAIQRFASSLKSKEFWGQS